MEKGGMETNKRQRETAALTRECSDNFASAWYGSGWVMGKHCIAVLETTGKGKSFGVLKSLVYHVHLGAVFCVWILSSCSLKKIGIEMLKDLKNPHFKRSAKPC